MNIPRVVNATADFVASRPLWQVKAACLVVAVALGAWWVHGIGKAGEARGQQELRDSLSAVTALRLHAQADSARAHADVAVAVARATADSVKKESDGFSRAVDALTYEPIPVLHVTGDSLRFAGDSEVYVLPKPVVTWMVVANARMTTQDSLLHVAADVINVGVPRLRAGYEAALAAKDSAIVNLDSVARFEHARWQDAAKRIGTNRPSKFQTVLKWVEIGGAAYVGYRVGHGR